MSEYNFAGEHSQDMRGVCLRLYVENHLSDGTITHYTEDDIKKFVAKYWDGNSEIGYALHDKDVDPDGNLKGAHYHINMYRTVRGNYHFDAIVNALPGVHVEKMKKKEEAFAYLIHATFPNKYQYDVKDVVLNFPIEQFEEYVAIAVERYQVKEKAHAESVAKRDANKNMRAELLLNDFQRKKHDLEIEQLYFEYRTKILQGEIGRRAFENMVVADAGGVLSEMASTYSAKIEKSFKTRLSWMTNNIKGRDLTVIAIEGTGGGGKTLLATRICEEYKWFYSISSAKNDPFQTVQEDDDCFILNEFRDSTIPFSEFLRTTEPYLNNQLGSRFHNKGFFGKFIIITTPTAIKDWYRGVGVADGNYDGKSTRNQFDRRIHYIIKIQGKNEEYLSVYKHFPDGHDELLKRYHNPVALVPADSKVKHLLDDSFWSKPIDSMADVLKVKDAYEDKKQEAVPDGYIEPVVCDMDGHVVNSIDLAFIFDKAVNEIRDHKISHNDAIEYLMDKLKTYNGGKE